MPRAKWNPVKMLQKAGVEPAEVVSASTLVEMLGNTHPLVLPVDPQGEALHDFSKLDLLVPHLAEARSAPVLPVNVAHLWRLCREHRKKIQK